MVADDKVKEFISEAEELLYDAWCVIANSGLFGNPPTPTEGAPEAAVRWRDSYHEYLSAVRASRENTG